MTFLDLLRPPESWDPQRVRRLLEESSGDDYLLLDVRQPAEYREGHLPGARLLPLDRLEEASDELDRDRIIVTCCRTGHRSRAAAAMLLRRGFTRVHDMAGGLRAWEGGVAQGDPQVDLERFRDLTTPQEQVVLAWRLEGGTRRFYRDVGERLGEEGAGRLFRKLAAEEAGHQKTLRVVFEALAGRPAAENFPAGEAGEVPGDPMEGGFDVGEALTWAAERSADELLEFAAGIEANALDRYLLLQRELPDENSRRAFEVLCGEERRHLRELLLFLEGEG